MKKYILTLFILLLSSFVFAEEPSKALVQVAWGVLPIEGNVSAAVAECTAFQTFDGASSGVKDIKDDDCDTFNGARWTTTQARTICKVSLWLNCKDTGGNNCTSNTYHVELWTTDGFNMGDQVGGDSDGVVGDLGWAETQVDFEFSTPVELADSTEYLFAITHNNAPSASTEASIHYETEAGEMHEQWLSNENRCNKTDDRYTKHILWGQ